MAVASAGHVQICTSLQTDNHTSTSPLSFLQAGCPSCRPTNSVKALKAQAKETMKLNRVDQYFLHTHDIMKFSCICLAIIMASVVPISICCRILCSKILCTTFTACYNNLIPRQDHTPQGHLCLCRLAVPLDFQ